MREVFDAFWRAAAYCLHWRVILWSLAPVLLAAGGVLVLGWLWWQRAVDALSATLAGWTWLESLLQWFDSIGAGALRDLLAPLLIVIVAVPLVVVLSLLLVALLMTPSITALVARRRFPQLDRRRGAGWFATVAWSLAATVTALLALVLSLPLWLIPPLALVLPPLIWGWLTYRLFAFEVLAGHADAGERRRVLREQRGPLLAIGIVCGYMGAAPALLWAIATPAMLPFAPLLLVAAVWLYTLIFAFAAAWFAHYALAALQALRALQAQQAQQAAAPTIPLAQPTPLAPPPRPGTEESRP